MRKDIVPLMLQRKYRADGWLGMIVGTKLWFSLFEAQKFEHSIEGLKKELGERGKIMSKTQGGEPIVKGNRPSMLHVNCLTPGHF